MESQDILDPNDEVNSLALQLIYMPRINRALDYFSSQWNSHPISTEGNRSPLQVWTAGFYQFAESNYQTVRDVLDTETTDINFYGIDDNSPAPQIETSNHIVIPRSTIDLSEEQLYMLVNEIRPLDEDNNYGINFYQRIVMLIDELLESE